VDARVIVLGALVDVRVASDESCEQVLDARGSAECRGSEGDAGVVAGGDEENEKNRRGRVEGAETGVCNCKSFQR